VYIVRLWRSRADHYTGEGVWPSRR
jgi:hypothetical protein